MRNARQSLRLLQFVLIAGLAMMLMPGSAMLPQAGDKVELKVLGGLAGISQYTRYEEPFWRETVPQLTGGRVLAEIAPFDRAGFRGDEMLRLMRLGVVPFGTALLSLASAEEPEFDAVDLPTLNPSIEKLAETVRLYRPHLRALLRDRYGIELLAIYTHPAQVTWCSRPFAGLSDLAGRRVRTSSVSQTEMFSALGARAIVIPFAGMVEALRGGVVECAVTGTLSGNAIGLHKATSHVHGMALGWGVSVFGANIGAWNALPPDIQASLREGLTRLEAQIWEAAAAETGDGLACNAGMVECSGGERGHMSVVPVTPADNERRRQLLVSEVLPRWVERCGRDCVGLWNTYLGPANGIMIHED